MIHTLVGAGALAFLVKKLFDWDEEEETLQVITWII